jgi:predicted DNA-binding protein (UPF0251 family)
MAALIVAIFSEKVSQLEFNCLQHPARSFDMQQREMGIFGELRPITDAPVELVKMCDDELEAIHLCIQLGSHTHDYIGKKLGIDRGHFSRMLSGAAGFPTTKRLALMRLCGNRAPVQYEVMNIGMDGCVDENAALRGKVAALEAALAAMLHSPRAA